MSTGKQASSCKTHVVGEAAGERHERRGVCQQNGAAVGCAVVEQADVVEKQQRRGSSQEDGAAAVLRPGTIGEPIAQHDVRDVDAKPGGGGARHYDEPRHAAPVQRASARQCAGKCCIVRHARSANRVAARRAAAEAVPHRPARRRRHERCEHCSAVVALQAEGARDDERPSERDGQPSGDGDARAARVSKRDAKRVAAAVVQVRQHEAAELRVDAAAEDERVGMEIRFSTLQRRRMGCGLQLRAARGSGARDAQRQQRRGDSTAAHCRRCGRGN